MSDGSVDNEVLRTKAARHDAILTILGSEPVTSQEQLRQVLAKRGFDTVQTTLSRDLTELRATKVKTAEGVAVYSVPGAEGYSGPTSNQSPGRLVRWCQELLIGAEVAQNILVARTPSGAANMLGAALDAAALDGVVGTIAGDDTIMVVCRTPEVADELRSNLLQMAQSSSKTSGQSS